MSNSTIQDTLRRPLLSFVIAGRNDGFMGDFNWRLSTSINIMARGAAKIGRLQDIEVIIADWNSQVPLHKVLELVPEARAITRFLCVPDEVAISAQGDTEFDACTALNLGIRRARGEFARL